MVYRTSWIAGVVGIVFALARAERLLRSSVDGLPWEVILVAAVVLGVTLTWAGLAYRLSGRAIAVVNVIAVALTAIRVAVPQTTWFIFPTASTFPALSAEMSFARDVIRTGVAPVIPLAGIVAILAIVFWGMGALLTWGLLTGRPYVAVLAPLVVYLEFAVMDRRPGGPWIIAFMVVLGACLLAVAFDRRRDGTGVLTSGATRMTLVRSLPSVGLVTLVATIVVAATASGALASLVPHNGYLDWRSQSSLTGEYYGSISYNPFVGIRQNLLSQTNVPVFVATVSGDIPGDQLYWRLVTLDTYDQGQWHVGASPRIASPEDADGYERSDMAFAGPTAAETATITVLALQMDWLPAPYAPVGLAAENDAVQHGFRVKVDDGSLHFDALTYRGMTYTVTSDIPQPDLDVLGRLDDGTPSVVFRGAVNGGDFAFDSTAPSLEQRQLPDEERYVALPDDLDTGIASLARAQTRGLQTDFERAIALEEYFQSSSNFRYSTDVVPGHGATDLAAWLLDPESDNYHIGYCEQFATSMAVMARTLGIPSRVILGFGPGTTLDDGRIVIRDRNAHAWVELWMPTQGWVQFDPTPRGDTVPTTDEIPFDIAPYLEIPETTPPPFEGDLPDPRIADDDPSAAIPDIPTDTPRNSIPLPNLPGWSYLAALAIVAAFGLLPGVKRFRRWRRVRRLDYGDVSAAWFEIVDRLADLGDAPSSTETPAEIAGATDPVMEPLADVYAEFVYGSGEPLTRGKVTLATRSMEETEDRLASRYSAGRRFVSHYRLRSLWPRWMRRRE
jgi:hypothetical protein